MRLRVGAGVGVSMLLDSTALLPRKHVTKGDGAWKFDFPPESDSLLFDDVVLFGPTCVVVCVV